MILCTHMHKHFIYAAHFAHTVLYCRKSLCGAMNIVQLCANVSQNMYFEHNTKSRNGSQKFNPSTKISRKSSEKKNFSKNAFQKCIILTISTSFNTGNDVGHHMERCIVNLLHFLRFFWDFLHHHTNLSKRSCIYMRLYGKSVQSPFKSGEILYLF